MSASFAHDASARSLRPLLGALLLAASLSTSAQTVPAPALPEPASAQPSGQPSAQAPSLAGRYAGTLPCADCEGIAWRLDLFADGSYFLNTRALGKADPASIDELGRWSLASDASVLALLGSQPPRLFAVHSEGLSALDAQGQPLAGNAPARLQKDDNLAALSPRFSAAGIYRHVGEQPQFTECATGRNLSLAPSSAFNALELAYKRRARRDGEALMAQIDGHIDTRSDASGTPQMMLVVDNFDGFRVGVACPPPATNAPLAGTRWVPEIANLPARPVHAPHLIFGNGGEVSGAGPCNRLTGQYQADGAQLRLGPLGSTKMACAEGQEQENALTAALEASRRWRVIGSTLELFGEDGKPLLRLHAEASAQK